MSTPSDIIAGTITLTNGSTAIVGVGTSWSEDDLRNGDLIVFIEGGEEFAPPIINAITDNLNGTLIEPWAGPTLSGVRYRIRYQWDSSRVSAQARAMIQKLGNGNVEALAALTGPGVPVFDGPHSITIKPETDFINGVAFNVQVDTLADRAAYDGQSTGFAVLVSDVGDGRSAVYSKNSNTSADWSDPAYITGPVGPMPDVQAGTITTGLPGTAYIVTIDPITGGYEINFTIPAPPGFYWENAYNPANTYAESSVVRLNGSSFIAVQAVPLATPPSGAFPPVDTAYWEVLASRGANGAGTIESIVAGTGIDVDNTDPANPIISAEAQEITIIAGQGVRVDSTDPTEPIISVALSPPQGRLTTASGIAVMTANALAATTVYYTPSNGNMVPINDGTKFVPRLFTELSQTTTDTTKSPAACAANTNYDMFLWDDGGTLRCTRGPAWSNSGAGTSARGTGAGTSELDFSTAFATNKNAITNGPAAGRGTYVGSIRTNASSQIDMSFGGSASGGVAGFNGIWNKYNRALGAFLCFDTGSGYTYSADVIRQARASVGNQHTLFCGLVEDAYFASYALRVDTDATSGAYGQVGIGINTKVSFNTQRVFVRTVAAVIQIGSPYLSITRMPQLGHVVIAALECGNPGGNVITFNPDATSALQAEMWW